MVEDRFAYCLNAVYYGIWLHAISYGNFIHKLVYGSIRLFARYMCSRNCQERLYAYLAMREQQLYEFKHDKKKGFYIGWVKYKFGYIYSSYSGFLSLMIWGLIYINYGMVNQVITTTVLLIPIVICYIPAYKAVFADNRYLKYFKEFETKGEKWHKKWKRITVVFCFGGFAIVIFGVAILFYMMIGWENIRSPFSSH